MNYYLKYNLRNNIVKESVVELLINDEFKQYLISYSSGNDEECIQDVNTLNNGVYEFKHADIFHNGVCLSQYLKQSGECADPYYEDNINTLKQALGSLFDYCYSCCTPHGEGSYSGCMDYCD